MNENGSINSKQKELMTYYRELRKCLKELRQVKKSGVDISETNDRFTQDSLETIKQMIKDNETEAA